jgi:hypothetical protein
MFIPILLLILLLPSAFFPLLLKVTFTSDELLDMGVYQEELQSFEVTPQRPCASRNSYPACTLNSLPT